MFIEDFVDVDVGFAAVRSCLDGDPGPWMTPCAHQAEEAGAEVVVRLGPAGALAPARRRVRVRVGQSRLRGEAVVVPLEWESIRLRTFFPRLEGDLEVAPLGEGRSRLTLCGQYSPPLGAVGVSLDRRLLHKVAESTVRSFLGGVKDVLDRDAGNELVQGDLPALRESRRLGR